MYSLASLIKTKPDTVSMLSLLQEDGEGADDLA